MQPPDKRPSPTPMLCRFKVHTRSCMVGEDNGRVENPTNQDKQRSPLKLKQPTPLSAESLLS